MYTFCRPISVLSFITFTFGGIYSDSFGVVAISTPSPRPILVQTVEHKPDECAPSQLSGPYTHDIACVLETFDSILYNQVQLISMHDYHDMNFALSSLIEVIDDIVYHVNCQEIGIVTL